MAVSFHAAGALFAAASGTSITPVLPAGCVADDIIVFVAWCNLSTTFTPPSGYLSIGTPVADGNLSCVVLWKRHTGTESNPTATSSLTGSSTAGLYGRIYVFRGARTWTQPFYASVNNLTATTSTTPVTSDPAASAGVGGYAACFVAVDDDNTWASGMPPSGWSNIGGILTSTTGGDAMSDAIGQVGTASLVPSGVTVGTMSAADYWIVTTGVIAPPIPATLSAFRFYNDDAAPDSSTALAAQNTGITVADANAATQLRIQVQNGANTQNSTTWSLQYRLNGGAWANIAASGAGVIYQDSSFYTNATVITASRLTGGAGSFSNGRALDTSSGSTIGIPAANYTEFVWNIGIVASAAVNGDVYEFRLVRITSVATDFTYTQVPSITIGTVGPTDWPGTVSSSWGGWTATAVGTFEHPATVSSAWGATTHTAIGKIEVTATAATAWGGWTATATATVERRATTSSTWAWTATAVATVEHPATTAAAWSGWTATAAATFEHPAATSAGWGGLAATAVGSLEHPATITSAWGLWVATGVAVVGHPATISSTGPGWYSQATATQEGVEFGFITSDWGELTATATAQPFNRTAAATTAWGGWSTSSAGGVTHELVGSALGVWGGWSATSSATMLHLFGEWNGADVVGMMWGADDVADVFMVT